MRRYMPPLNHLRAFEAAVRHESFTKAAEELDVTQGAVSRHIRDLEAYLGFALFQRVNNTLYVPYESRQFAEALTNSLDQIDRGSQALKQVRRRTVLTLRSYTNLLVRWLIPLLPAFQGLYPQIEVRLSATREEANFAVDDTDLDIRFGTGEWPGLAADLLFRIDMVPVCTPALAERLELREPSDVLKATVYHSFRRRREWSSWFAQVSEQPFKPAGEVLSEDQAVSQQCVLAGMGVGLLQRQFIAEDLAAGRLVIPFDIPLRSDAGFYVVCPHDHLKLPKTAAFRAWLLDIARRG
jgi:LysR family glycine cleavage system transcriptional activator